MYQKVSLDLCDGQKTPTERDFLDVRVFGSTLNGSTQSQFVFLEFEVRTATPASTLLHYVEWHLNWFEIQYRL